MFQGYISATSAHTFGNAEASVVFYDEYNNNLGTAKIQATLNGLDPQLIEFVGKGDLTNYKAATTSIKLDKFDQKNP